MITNPKRLKKILTTPVRKRTDWKAIELYSGMVKLCKERKTKNLLLNIKPVTKSLKISNISLRYKLKKLEQIGLIEVTGIGRDFKIWQYDIEMSYEYNKLGNKTIG